MTIKNLFCIFCLMTLMATFVFGTVFAQVTVGVKEGYMIEYQVECTGEVPEDHNVTKASIEVVNVRDKIVDIKFTSIFKDETQKNDYSSLNLETGKLGECFIIPSNLTEGQTFFDQNAGNITISKTEERAYAGVKRTTVTASTPQTIWHWDQQTGFLVEAKSTYTNFTITTTAKETNIWEPQPYEVDPTVSIVLVVAVIAAVFGIVAFRILKK